MTVSLGNGVDIGNLVTSEINPVTGRLRKIQAGTASLGGFALEVLRSSALFKPYGTSDASFGKSTGLSTTAATICTKQVVDAPFIAARLVSTNRGNQAITGIKAVIGATETMASDTSANLSTTVISGTSYAVLAGATDQNGQRAVTWSGAATFDHGASSASGPDLKISDVIPINAIPAAGGGVGYPIFNKIYRKGDTNGNWAFSNIIATPAPSAANRNRPVVSSINFGDGVGTIGATFSLTTTANDVATELWFDRPVLSVWGVGDSTLACSGLVADKTSSWLHRACADLTTADVPIIHANFGAAGMTSADFMTNVTAYLAAGITPPSALIVSMSINEIGATPDVRKMEIARKTLTDAAALCIKYKIPYLAVTPMMPNENIATGVLDNLRKQLNTDGAAIAARYGFNWLSGFGSVGDGASPEKYIPANKLDAIHPNESAIESILTPAAKAFIAEI